MTTPVEYELPASIPTVKVTGEYRGWDGRGLAGTVTFTGPGLVTFPEADLFIGGPVVAKLDEFGRFSVTLPATDAPNMNPSDWSYTVKENLSGVVGSRTFAMLLPADTPVVDLADIAPADPLTPNYVPVPGPQGETGPQGVAGSQVYTGTAAPTAELGVDGDVFTQYTTTTYLGVTSTTVAMWSKSAGVWTRVGGDVRGAAWYFNTSSTSSADTKPGDMLLRTDTGDIWQRGASGWGSVVGNLKGPKGDTGATGAKGDTGTRGSKVYQGPAGNLPEMLDGDVSVNPTTGAIYWREGGAWVNKGNITGPQGPKGDTGPMGPEGPEGPQGPAGADGTGAGTVTAVNTVEPDANGNVTLSAANVGAIPAADKGVGVATLGTDGKVPASQLPTLADPNAVTSVNGQSGPTVTLTAANVGALATSTKGAANGVASLDASSLVTATQLPTSGFRPGDLGFKAWAFDPAASQTGGRAVSTRSFRLVAIPVRQTMTVSKVAFHVLGYEGTGIDSGSYVSIFDANGARKAVTTNMTDTSHLTDTHNTGGETRTVNLSSSVTLTPGIYYVGFYFVIGNSANAPMFMTAESTNACPVPTLNTIRPFGVISGLASNPTSFSPSAIEYDPIRFWAALV